MVTRKPPLVSVRMRASQGEKHVSGGETLVPRRDARRTVRALLSRPVVNGTESDKIVLTCEQIDGACVQKIAALPVRSLEFGEAGPAREEMRSLLIMSGVSPEATAKGLRHINRRPIAGAAILDAVTGDRLDPKPAKGVRVTRVGWAPRARAEQVRTLAKRGVRHHRAIEALALASKVSISGAVAEVCRSDDPAYLAGYVASKKIGYVRLTPVKEKGDARGGRVVFVKKREARAVISFLAERPVVVDRPGSVGA